MPTTSQNSTTRNAAEIHQWMAREASRRLPFWHLVLGLLVATAPLLFMIGVASNKLDTLVVDVAEIKGGQHRHDGEIDALNIEVDHMRDDMRELKEYNRQLTIWRGFRAEHENAVKLKLWPNSAP